MVLPTSAESLASLPLSFPLMQCCLGTLLSSPSHTLGWSQLYMKTLQPRPLSSTSILYTQPPVGHHFLNVPWGSQNQYFPAGPVLSLKSVPLPILLISIKLKLKILRFIFSSSPSHPSFLNIQGVNGNSILCLKISPTSPRPSPLFSLL